MAGLIRKTDTSGMARPRTAWDPLERMREMFGWDPFREFGTLTPYAEGAGAGMYTPNFEVKEKGDAILIKADLPGIKEQDLDISLQGDRLVVSGKREEEKREEGETYYTYERDYGSFSRSFTLPEGVDTDNANAELKEGVLTLMLPKKQASQPKKISLGSKGKGAKA
jgi:HSP20 family protein